MKFAPPQIDWIGKANSWRWEHDPFLRDLYVELFEKHLSGEIEYIDFLILCGLNAICLTKEEYKILKENGVKFTQDCQIQS